MGTGRHEEGLRRSRRILGGLVVSNLTLQKLANESPALDGRQALSKINSFSFDIRQFSVCVKDGLMSFPLLCPWETRPIRVRWRRPPRYT